MTNILFLITLLSKLSLLNTVIFSYLKQILSKKDSTGIYFCMIPLFLTPVCLVIDNVLLLEQGKIAASTLELLYKETIQDIMYCVTKSYSLNDTLNYLYDKKNFPIDPFELKNVLVIFYDNIFYLNLWLNESYTKDVILNFLIENYEFDNSSMSTNSNISDDSEQLNPDGNIIAWLLLFLCGGFLIHFGFKFYKWFINKNKVMVTELDSPLNDPFESLTFCYYNHFYILLSASIIFLILLITLRKKTND